MAKTENAEQPAKRGRKPGVKIGPRKAGLKLDQKVIGNLFVNYAMDKKISKADKLKFLGVDENQLVELLRQCEKMGLLDLDFDKALEAGAVKLVKAE
jgi:hypothetical protein